MWQQWKTELQWTEHLMEVEEVEGGVEGGGEEGEEPQVLPHQQPGHRGSRGATPF